MKSLKETIASLPPVWPDDPLPAIRTANAKTGGSMVVLDDDPTGTQTVYDIPVLTEWTVDTLTAELRRETALFYVLTNSRSFPNSKAESMARELGCNLLEASRNAGRPVTVISRSDSTLRGHYPLEVDALLEAMGHPEAAHLIVPFFEEGGRYSIDDIHYVAEGDRLVPASETPFAQDASFGFRHSNLREWVEEKTRGRIRASDVQSISIDDVRKGGPSRVTEKLVAVQKRGVCVVNAAAMRDVEVFVAGLIEAERNGKSFIARTAASYVRARAGLEKRPPLNSEGLFLATSYNNLRRQESRCSGMVVVGSHVPKTTSQLKVLLNSGDSRWEAIELRVPLLLHQSRDKEIARVVQEVETAMAEDRDVVLFTSRDLVAATDSNTSLDIGSKVSSALVDVVRQLKSVPRYIVAKGGITSSDVATRGLDVKRALVAGQILPGIPVWRLGGESRFPGMPYVVFPGNVGGDDALWMVYRKLKEAV